MDIPLYLKWITNKVLLNSTGLLCAVWQPGWEGVWGRMDTYILGWVPLLTPETVTTLLSGRTKQKKIKKKLFSF